MGDLAVHQMEVVIRSSLSIPSLFAAAANFRQDNSQEVGLLLDSGHQRFTFIPDQSIDADRLGEQVAKGAGIEQIRVEEPVSYRWLVDSRFTPTLCCDPALEQVDEGTIDIGLLI